MGERKIHVFDNPTTGFSNNGWIGPDFIAARRPISCDVAHGRQFDLVAKSPLLKAFFTWHTSALHWWVFLPRIDQYWGMFAPDPGNIDFWLVIDSQLISRNNPSVRVERDIWKDYALGKDSDGRVSFEKPKDLHALSVSDRWRKYVYNLLGAYRDNKYKRYFAESWCRKYNTEENPYILEKFTIYSMSQVILPNYQRSPIRKSPIWQHCCLKSGCFETKTIEKNPVK